MKKHTIQNTNQQPLKIPAAILALNLPSWMPRQVNQKVAKHLSQVARMPTTDAEIAREVDLLYPEGGGTDPESKLRRRVRACARETIIYAIAAAQVEAAEDTVFGGEEYAKVSEAQLSPVTGAGVSVTTERAISDAAKSAKEERERQRRQEELQRVLQWLSDCASALREYEVKECEALARRRVERLQLLSTEPVREP